jgi:hypothetical protein
VERFWSAHGWTRTPVDIEWRFSSRDDLVAVAGIELDPASAAGLLAEVTGTSVDYAVNLWWRRY